MPLLPPTTDVAAPTAGDAPALGLSTEEIEVGVENENPPVVAAGLLAGGVFFKDENIGGGIADKMDVVVMGTAGPSCS